MNGIEYVLEMNNIDENTQIAYANSILAIIDAYKIATLRHTTVNRPISKEPIKSC